MIVKASDAEAKVLDRCLEITAPHVDGIFLTITGENAACEAVAKKHNAVVSHYTWDWHFANARNFALYQVPKEFTHWFWMDCDDIPRGIEKLKDTVEAYPEVDGFTMNYLYEFDAFKEPTVVHLKTRVLKNDGCAKWVGALHEDFSETRRLSLYLIKDIEILHLTDDERTKDSTDRNVRVALDDYKNNPDDPRSYWNLGNALKMAGRDSEALDFFERFMASSKSDDEKFIILLRMSEIHLTRGDHGKALDNARQAVGIRPTYPDGHHMCGHVLFGMKRYEEARDAFGMGLRMKPPYLSIIVFNPRNYDYIPLMALAKTYYCLSRPDMSLICIEQCTKIYPKDKNLKESAQKMKVDADIYEKVVAEVTRIRDIKDDKELIIEIEKLPIELQSHPGISSLRNQRIIKRASSGRDLVIYCGHTDQEWTPEVALNKGVGGSEEAVIHIAKRLAKLGWNVTVFNNCGHTPLVDEGVTYRPYWTWNYRDKQDVVILWRHPRPVDYGINADRIYIDLHDVVQPGEFNADRIAKIAKIFVKSKAHRDLFPDVPDDKFAIVPNGIVWDEFQQDLERDPNLIINTSSPDRSLSTLVDLFIEVKEQFPEARLQWAYGWGLWDTWFAQDHEAQAWKKAVIEKIAKTEGFECLGRIGHRDVAKLYQKAAVFAYPTAFFEIDCISARKAQAGGAVPIVTDFAALDETVQFGEKIHVDPALENWGKPYKTDFGLMGPEQRKAWVDACVAALKAPPIEENRQKMREWTKQFDWDEITNRWNVILQP
jgi:glycosyltransferase involved in cell wall biosynthesis